MSFKLNNNLLPANTRDFFNINQNIHQYNTRNRNSVRVKKHSSALFNNSIFNKAIHEWTNVRGPIKNLNTIKTFIKAVTTDIVNSY
jgi:hypothetical protein